MPIDKEQSSQIVNEAKLPVLRTALREQLDSVLTKVEAELRQPLRIFASDPLDSKLNISSNAVVLADGATRTTYPIDSLVQAFAQTTIDFQSGAISPAANVTVLGAAFALPASTTGQYRRMALALQNSGKVDVIFSPSVASYGVLQDIASLFASLTGTPIGWVDLVGTATSTPGAYKTASSAASSATSIIENSVGGVSSIFRFGTGSGGGSGLQGDPSSETIKNHLNASVYKNTGHSVFVKDGSAKIGSVSGASYDLGSKTVLFTANAQVMTSINLLDAEFLTLSKDVTQIDLLAIWNKGTITAYTIPPSFTYDVSRDGGSNYFTVTMNRVGTTEVFYGTLRFDTTTTTEGSKQGLLSITAEDSDRVLNATTQQAEGQAFTITTPAKIQELQLKMTKTGTPLGNVYASIVADNAGVPSLLASGIMSQSAFVTAASIAAGPALVTFDLPDIALPAGTYHVIIQSDAAYKASFVNATTQLSIRQRTTGASTPYQTAYNGTAYATATTNSQMYYVLNGRPMDLRVRITSAGSPTYPCSLAAFGTFYNFADIGAVGPVLKRQVFSFNSVTDNLSSFAITAFNPDVNLLQCFHVQKMGVAVSPAFALQGNTATFPADTFYNGGISETVTLIFSQPGGNGTIDNADSNARLLATNHLGSTSATDDKSGAGGGGIFLRRPDGVLREIFIDNNDNITVRSTP